MCSSTLWNGLFDRLLVNTLFRCLITGWMLYDLSVLLSLSLLEEWRFSEMDWNLALVMKFLIFLFRIYLSVDQQSSKDGNLLIPIIKFIPRNAFISPSIVSKLQSFYVEYLFVFVKIFSRSFFTPVAVSNMSKGLEPWSRSTSNSSSIVNSFFIKGFSLFSYFHSSVVLFFFLLWFVLVLRDTAPFLVCVVLVRWSVDLSLFCFVFHHRALLLFLDVFG